MDNSNVIGGNSDVVLSVRNLQTDLYPRRGRVRAVDGVSFSLARGETLGIVGESGSGKTMLAMSLMRMVPKPVAQITGGEVFLEGRNLLEMSDDEMRRVRGRDIAMILQDPHSSLNPVFTLGFQMDEAIKFNAISGMAKPDRVRRALDALRTVHLPDPERHLKDYPHQLSGGMKQRVIGALAIAGNPKVIIADEPTTALDLTVQAQYLSLLGELQREHGVSLVIITHDFGVIAELCDNVLVMYAGRIIESGSVEQIFDDPRHPYTQGLLGCIPEVGTTLDRLPAIQGQPPDLARLPSGCSFEPRCRYRDDRCAARCPDKFVLGGGHEVECWRLEDDEWIPS